MIISNIRNVEVIPSIKHQRRCWAVADVDVTSTSGFWLWRKTKTTTRSVFKDEMSNNWVWVDNARSTPGDCVEQLYNSFLIQAKLKKIDR